MHLSCAANGDFVWQFFTRTIQPLYAFLLVHTVTPLLTACVDTRRGSRIPSHRSSLTSEISPADPRSRHGSMARTSIDRPRRKQSIFVRCRSPDSPESFFFANALLFCYFSILTSRRLIVFSFTFTGRGTGSFEAYQEAHKSDRGGFGRQHQAHVSKRSALVFDLLPSFPLLLFSLDARFLCCDHCLSIV